MGKNSSTKNGKKRKRKEAQRGAAAESTNADSKYEPTQQPAAKKLAVSLPPPFPSVASKSIRTKDSFLRNDDPSVKDTFQLALETAYEGFAYDVPPKSLSPNIPWHFDEIKIQKALGTLHKYNWFRTDITQPFGLGTACARTYVTRLLLGEPGTTYKYLGLRMFAHSWIHHDDDDDDDETKSLDTVDDLNQAVATILQLNQQLTHRTRIHLHNLEMKRLQRMGIKDATTAKVVKGRAKFDITLINRMTDTPELKREPTTGEGRCAVAWHADSTLEHYSTIAVYQTMTSGSTNIEPPSHHNFTDYNRWSLALRLAHHAEGPSAAGISNDTRKKDEVESTPSLAITLPPGAAYYLLDDFNHHHQHAVIINDSKHKKDSAGVRYASTHRLLREGHNVHHLIERCKNTVSQFHKKGLKIWRSEQLLLNELESEWIRQFYIQGLGHKNVLWMCWRKPMHTLLNYWGKLETRTKQTIDLLLMAAEARCGLHQSQDCSSPQSLKSNKKLNEKRKKALASIEDIIERGGVHGGNNSHKESRSILIEQLYNTIIQSLSERATMRQLWLDREADAIFNRMELEYQPLIVPFLFEYNDSLVNPDTANEDHGKSPLIGSPSGLKSICRQLEKAQVAYISCNRLDLA